MPGVMARFWSFTTCWGSVDRARKYSSLRKGIRDAMLHTFVVHRQLTRINRRLFHPSTGTEIDRSCFLAQCGSTPP